MGEREGLLLGTGADESSFKVRSKQDLTAELILLIVVDTGP